MGIAIMSTDLDKLHVVCQKTYKEQAVWFLNCFWEEFADKEAELIWQYVLKNAELDLENHETGSGLDEMKAHVFLERFDETLTVREMRAKLRSTGAIGESERPKLVPLMHYLLYKYNADWHTLVDETRQGDNKEELEKAEQMLKEVQQAFQESERAASAARKALLEAQSKEADAKAREAEAVERENAAKASEQQAKQREAAAKASAEESRKIEEQAKKDAVAAKQAEVDAQAAQKELEAALAELKKEEDAFNAKKSELERKGNDESIGLVTRNKAKNELAQLLAEDPLPLKRAKITQEAAVRKAEKATAHAAQTRQASEASAAAASKARAQAEQDAAQAESARKSAEADAAAASAARQQAEQKAQASAKASAEADVDAALARLKEAEDYLAEVRSRPGQAFGALWWIDRELHEQKKYIPESKGGIRK